MYNYNYTYVNYLFNYIYTILGHLFLQHTGRTLELVIVLIDDQTEIIVNEAPVDPKFSRTARAAWARLIQKVYEVDPMLCPHCGAEMRLMALIEDPPDIEKILKHLHLWNPCPPSQAPPMEDLGWPIPLTYAPLPDIA